MMKLNINLGHERIKDVVTVPKKNLNQEKNNLKICIKFFFMDNIGKKVTENPNCTL